MTNILHPTRDGDRIVTLDILRGIAILGILYLNIPQMGGNWPAYFSTGDANVLGSTGADQWAFRYIFRLLEGTQRGLLEFLFGASVIILTVRATAKDGPVEVADVYYRRALWLIAFGVVHGTILLWWGEIWTYYGLSALFAFPFRRLSARILLVIGSLGLILPMAIATPGVLDKVALQDRVEHIQARPAGTAMTKSEKADLKRWEALKQEKADAAKQAPDVRKSESGGYIENVKLSAGLWTFTLTMLTGPDAGEALFTMLIGMALFKWGILQGNRSRRFYLVLAISGYAIGVSIKMAQLNFFLGHQALLVGIGNAVHDYGRIGTTLGHVGLVCLVLKSGIGRRVLAMFKAPGRMPMTAYVGQTLICCWLLFPGFGFGLWGRFGWADLMLIATAVNAALIGVCNLWMLRYRMGPFEWVWRSLSYLERPAFRRDNIQSNPTAALA